MIRLHKEPMASINFKSTMNSAAGYCKALFACWLATSVSAYAAVDNNSDTQRWYQIEILIFAHKYEQPSTEVWREDIALAYPLNWVTLKDPNAIVETVSETIEGEKSVDLKAALPEPPASSTDNSMTGPEPTIAEAPSVDLERTAYYLLPPERRTLEPQAMAIRRSYNYRLLYQAAWRQPVTGADKASSILISGGDSYGEQHELEGSLSLSVSRYLHLKTNLWYTRFVNNYGQDRGNWPKLPLRPDLRQYDTPPSHNWEEAVPIWERFKPIDDEYDKILETPYIPKRISLLQQSRRMKSQEIHYIDHPHFGVVVLCSPYEAPDEGETDSELSSQAAAPEI